MPEGERRLAAIMFTDMVGYTALTQSDESQAMEVLDRHNRLLRPFFPKYHGKEVKAIGDSFLVEFGSALDATNCAVEIQRFLHDYNISSRDEWKITLRIGVHAGDVIHQAGDVFGDAVNIASRLQPLAEPEGVCVSDQVFGQVRNKIPQNLVRLGPQELKNVRFPVDVYKVVMPWEHEIAESVQELNLRRIAVLPFVSLSPDPNDEYFADGLTEELIDRLCQVRNLAVIARTSVMNYKGKEKNASQIGRELKAGALVEGSVRKAGNRIRVTAQLINANSEEHLWSSKYDRELEDIFALQTDIAENVASSLQMKLLPEDKKRIESKVPVNPEAYVEYLRGLHFFHDLSQHGIREAVQHFARAIELEPNYAAALAELSRCYLSLGYFAYEPMDQAYSKAKEFALKALRLDETIPEAHHSMANVFFFQEGKWTEAGTEYKRALELNPNFVDALSNYAWYLANLGRDDEAISEIDRALELDPLSLYGQMAAGAIYGLYAGKHTEALGHYEKALKMDPDSAIAHNDMGLELLYMGRREEGVRELEKSLALSGGSIFFKANLGWAYGNLGRKEEARQIAEELKNASRGTPMSAFVANVYAGMGEKDEALSWLERAYEDHTIIYNPLFTRDPGFANLRGEPRFRELVRKLGLESYQAVDA